MKLKDIVEICYGKNQKSVEVPFSTIPILGTGGVIGYASKPLYDKESVLIGRKGTIGLPFYIDKPFWTIDTLFYTKINKNKVIPKFLYYLLCTIGLTRYSEGAAVPSLTTKTLNEIDLNIPDMVIQQHIVDTIGSVDNLIENIDGEINKLEYQSTFCYLHNRVGNIKEKLGKCTEIKTGKLNADASIIDGEYPFFTCGKETLFINHYAFEGPSIVISGNGEIDVKYFDGKFNAYQRTYVLQPQKYLFLFLKECQLSINMLKNNAQGSVIKFITKGMLENISININADSELINSTIKNIYNLIMNLNKQKQKLSKIKALLLENYF